MDQFEQLLDQLSVDDNDTRSRAEQIYNNAAKNQPNETIQALLQVGRTSAQTKRRSFAILLLRRVLSSLEDGINKVLSPQLLHLLKSELLLGIEREEDTHVRGMLVDATCEFAITILDGSIPWAELCPWIIKLSQSFDHHKQCSLEITSQLALHLKEPFSGKNFPILKQLLQNGLEGRNPEVQTAALNATTNLITVFNQGEYRSEFQTLIPAMMNTLASAIISNHQESASASLKLLIDFLDLDPDFFTPVAGLVAEAMLKIASSDEIQEEVKNLSVEFIIAYCENKPTLLKGVPNVVHTLIMLLLKMMLDVEEIDITDWNQMEEAEEDNSNAAGTSVAQQGIDRICSVYSGDDIVPIVFAQIPQFISNQDWKYRYAALMAISMITEGCRDVLLPHAEKIIQMILPTHLDQHPRVRWAFSNAVGQLSTDLGPQLQKKYHSQVLPPLISLLDDNQNPRVQSHASSALINFCEKFEAKHLKTYLDNLLPKLLRLIQSGNKITQETALESVACISRTSGKYFRTYYPIFAPVVSQIINSATSSEQVLMRGKAVECFSYFAIAIGKEIFQKDASGVMNALIQMQDSGDDILSDFIMPSWIRISSCLGADFVPYLKYVVPPLLQQASQVAGMSLQPNSINDKIDKEGWDVVNLGDKSLVVHTRALEEKANALNLLFSYVDELRDGYFPYVKETVELMVPLMCEFFSHDGIRMSCLASMPCLLDSVKLHCEKTGENIALLQELFAYIFPKLVGLLPVEMDREVLAVALQALHGSITVVGPVLVPENVVTLMHHVRLIIESSRKRISDLKGDIKDDDPSYAIREELEKEYQIILEMAEVCGSLIVNYTSIFIENFTHISQLVGEMLQKNSTVAEKQLAICIFDDLLEHAKEQVHFLVEPFLPFILEYSQDSSAGLRQAALFGLGMIAQHAPTYFKNIGEKALQILINAIQADNSRSNTNAFATENAISAVGRIICYQPDVVGLKLKELVSMWISWLPLEADEVEAQRVHKQLCDMITGNHPHIFGDNYSNLPKILSIFSTVLSEESNLVTNDTRQVIKTILMQMQQQAPQLLQAAFAVLPPEEQHHLEHSVSQ